jgi:hypothetical protein
MKRVYHPWTKWECVDAGMYETTAPPPLSSDEAREQYRVFLSNTSWFEAALQRVQTEWPVSCEQFLSNENMNRIAWLGQSSMCIETRVPACFRGGFRLLSKQEQITANMTALKWLNIWLRSHDETDATLSMNMDEEPAEQTSTLACADNEMGTVSRVNHYIETWMQCGYSEDIPDQVPAELQRSLLAPSYKAIAQAILKNDMPLKSLGFVPKQSQYYGILKRMEIEARPKQPSVQLRLF